MPSCLAALVTTGSMMPLACIGPGDRCCVRGGVLVRTLIARQRIAPRLIDQRRRVAGGAMIAHRPVRARVLHDEEIERGDAAVLARSRPWRGRSCSCARGRCSSLPRG